MRTKLVRPVVVYWNNIPTPYVVERFNALADLGTVDFEAWFNDRSEKNRSWVVDETCWRFRHRYIPTTHFFGGTQHWPLWALGRRADLRVSLYAAPSFLFGWLVARLRGEKIGFWVEVTFDRWVNRSPVKELFKKWLFRRIDAVITVGDDGKRYARKYGAKNEKIFFAPHVIDVNHFAKGAAIARRGQADLHQELGLKGTTFIYVGRLWWGKGIEHLLDAFEYVQQQNTEEVSLLLVGDGPDEVRYKHICVERNIRNIIFVGFKQKPELPRYYAMADVFVFPTLGDPYGLVVDEAMACSLPVISTSAAGEIEDRIEVGANGYIVPPEDSAALAEPMLELARNPVLRERMGQVSAKKIQGHVPEKWARDFEGIVYTLLH